MLNSTLRNALRIGGIIITTFIGNYICQKIVDSSESSTSLDNIIDSLEDSLKSRGETVLSTSYYHNNESDIYIRFITRDHIYRYKYDQLKNSIEEKIIDVEF